MLDIAEARTLQPFSVSLYSGARPKAAAHPGSTKRT
jgi:hypothetical protein